MRKFVGVGLVALVVGGCNSSTGLDQLTFEGRHAIVTQSPLTIEGVVTVRNVGDKAVIVAAAKPCLMVLKAFLTPERSGEPAWQSPSPQACTLEARSATIAPGDYYEYSITTTVPTTLPYATYYLSLSGALGREVPAGQIQLGS